MDTDGVEVIAVNLTQYRSTGEEGLNGIVSIALCYEHACESLLELGFDWDGKDHCEFLKYHSVGPGVNGTGRES